MKTEHWRAWTCHFGCVDQYASSSALRDHFHKSHTTEVVGQDVEAIVNLSSKANVSCAEGPCPLCHGSITSIRHYQSHVGYHLEQLALFVLPTQDANEEAQECSDGNKPGTSQNSNQEAEEILLSLQKLSQEYRAEKTTPSDIDRQDDAMRNPSPPPAPAEISSPPETPAPADSNPQMDEVELQLEILQAENRIQKLALALENFQSLAELEQKIKKMGEENEPGSTIITQQLKLAWEESKSWAESEKKIRKDDQRDFKIETEENHRALQKIKDQLERTKLAAEKVFWYDEDGRKIEFQSEAKEKYEAALKAAKERLVQQKEERRRTTETPRQKTM